MDELDLYDDLDDFQEQQDKKSKELQAVEDKYQESLKTIEELREENKKLKKNIQRIELGFQSLLDTARAEISRKDKLIERLRKEKDDICFRRKIPHKATHTAENQQLLQRSSVTVSNPFRTSTDNEALINETASTSTTNTNGEKEDCHVEPHKRQRVHEDVEEYLSDYKRHRSTKDEDDNKYDHRTRKHLRTDDEDKKDRRREHYRENGNKDSHNRRDFSRNRSREAKDYDKAQSSRHKSSKSSEKTPERRSSKHYERSQSRGRDRSHKYERNSSHDGQYKDKYSKTASKSPTRRNVGRSDAKHGDHHHKEATKSTSSDKFHKYRDLGNEKSKNFQENEDNKSCSLEKETKQKQTDNSQNINLSPRVAASSKNEKTTEQENKTTENTKILPLNEVKNSKETNNETSKPMENLNKTSSLPEPSKLCTPRKIAIFDELFGPSPSECSSTIAGSSCKSTNSLLNNLKSILAKTTQAEVISSATTSPGEYTDISSGMATPKEDAMEVISSETKDKNQDQPTAKGMETNIDNCFILTQNVDKEVKTIACVDLTECLDDDIENEEDLVQIPGLDLCAKSKSKTTNSTTNDDNVTTNNEVIAEDKTVTKNLDTDLDKQDKETAEILKTKDYNDSNDIEKNNFDTAQEKQTDLTEHNSENYTKNETNQKNSENFKSNEMKTISKSLELLDNDLSKENTEKEKFSSINPSENQDIAKESVNSSEITNSLSQNSNELEKNPADTSDNVTSDVVIIEAVKSVNILSFKNPYNKENPAESSNGSNKSLNDIPLKFSEKIQTEHEDLLEKRATNQGAHEIQMKSTDEDETHTETAAILVDQLNMGTIIAQRSLSEGEDCQNSSEFKSTEAEMKSNSEKNKDDITVPENDIQLEEITENLQTSTFGSQPPNTNLPYGEKDLASKSNLKENLHELEIIEDSVTTELSDPEYSKVEQNRETEASNSLAEQKDTEVIDLDDENIDSNLPENSANSEEGLMETEGYNIEQSKESKASNSLAELKNTEVIDLDENTDSNLPENSVNSEEGSMETEIIIDETFNEIENVESDKEFEHTDTDSTCLQREEHSSDSLKDKELNSPQTLREKGLSSLTDEIVNLDNTFEVIEKVTTPVDSVNPENPINQKEIFKVKESKEENPLSMINENENSSDLSEKVFQNKSKLADHTKDSIAADIAQTDLQEKSMNIQEISFETKSNVEVSLTTSVLIENNNNVCSKKVTGSNLEQESSNSSSNLSVNKTEMTEIITSLDSEAKTNSKHMAGIETQNNVDQSNTKPLAEESKNLIPIIESNDSTACGVIQDERTSIENESQVPKTKRGTEDKIITEDSDSQITTASIEKIESKIQSEIMKTSSGISVQDSKTESQTEETTEEVTKISSTESKENPSNNNMNSTPKLALECNKEDLHSKEKLNNNELELTKSKTLDSINTIQTEILKPDETSLKTPTQEHCASKTLLEINTEAEKEIKEKSQKDKSGSKAHNEETSLDTATSKSDSISKELQKEIAKERLIVQYNCANNAEDSSVNGEETTNQVEESAVLQQASLQNINDYGKHEALIDHQDKTDNSKTLPIDQISNTEKQKSISTLDTTGDVTISKSSIETIKKCDKKNDGDRKSPQTLITGTLQKQLKEFFLRRDKDLSGSITKTKTNLPSKEFAIVLANEHLSTTRYFKSKVVESKSTDLNNIDSHKAISSLDDPTEKLNKDVKTNEETSVKITKKPTKHVKTNEETSVDIIDKQTFEKKDKRRISTEIVLSPTPQVNEVLESQIETPANKRQEEMDIELIRIPGTTLRATPKTSACSEQTMTTYKSKYGAKVVEVTGKLSNNLKERQEVHTSNSSAPENPIETSAQEERTTREQTEKINEVLQSPIEELAKKVGDKNEVPHTSKKSTPENLTQTIAIVFKPTKGQTEEINKVFETPIRELTKNLGDENEVPHPSNSSNTEYPKQTITIEDKTIRDQTEEVNEVFESPIRELTKSATKIVLQQRDTSINSNQETSKDFKTSNKQIDDSFNNKEAAVAKSIEREAKISSNHKEILPACVPHSLADEIPVKTSDMECSSENKHFNMIPKQTLTVGSEISAAIDAISHRMHKTLGDIEKTITSYESEVNEHNNKVNKEPSSSISSQNVLASRSQDVVEVKSIKTHIPRQTSIGEGVNEQVKSLNCATVTNAQDGLDLLKSKQVTDEFIKSNMKFLNNNTILMGKHNETNNESIRKSLDSAINTHKKDIGETKDLTANLSQNLADKPEICPPNNSFKRLITKEINIEGEIIEVVKIQYPKDSKAVDDLNKTQTSHGSIKLSKTTTESSNTNQQCTSSKVQAIEKILAKSNPASPDSPENRILEADANNSCEKSPLNVSKTPIKETTTTALNNEVGYLTPKSIPKETQVTYKHSQEKDSYHTISSILPETFSSVPILPSISTTSPTPSNFSGLFSKKSTSTIITPEEDLLKSKKKSPHFMGKPKEYILPAASVLCNVDNLENATKANKKLHWELLENKNEMTEIEDDADVDTTDEEEPKIKQEPLENASTSPKQQTSLRQNKPTKQKKLQKSSPSETDTQTEDESLLNELKRQTSTYKKLERKSSKVHKPKQRKHKLPKSVKARLKAIAMRNAAAAVPDTFIDNNLIIQQPFSIVLPKRPVGRPRKLLKNCAKVEQVVQHKKRGRKPKQVVCETNEQEIVPRDSKSNESFKGKKRNSSERNSPDVVNNLENSMRILSSSVERLEICDETCSSRDSIKQRKFREKQLEESKNKDAFNTSMIYHKQDTSTENLNTSALETPETESPQLLQNPNKQDSLSVKTKFPDSNTTSPNTYTLTNPQAINASSRETEVQHHVKTNKVSSNKTDLLSAPIIKEPIIKHLELPSCSRETHEKRLIIRSDSESDKGPSKELSHRKKKEKSLKLKPKILMKKKLKSKIKNKVTPFISLQDIGIKVRPLKGHLSSFKIPKIKKDTEETIDNSWKLEAYEELEKEGDKQKGKVLGEQEKDNENVFKERRDTEKDDKEREAVNNMKDCQKDKEPPGRPKIPKEQETTGIKENLPKPLEKEANVANTSQELKNKLQSKDDTKTPSTNYIINFDNKTKTGKRKLFSPDMYDDAGMEEIIEKSTDNNSRETYHEQCQYLSETHELNPVTFIRKSLNFPKKISDLSQATHSEGAETSTTEPRRKSINVHRRILDSSSDEDDLNTGKTNEDKQKTETSKMEAKVEISSSSNKKETKKPLRGRRKSMYVESTNQEAVESEESETNKQRSIRRKSMYIERTALEAVDSGEGKTIKRNIPTRRKSMYVESTAQEPIESEENETIKDCKVTRTPLAIGETEKETTKQSKTNRRNSLYVESASKEVVESEESEVTKCIKSVRRKSMYVERTPLESDATEEETTERSNTYRKKSLYVESASKEAVESEESETTKRTKPVRRKSMYVERAPLESDATEEETTKQSKTNRRKSLYVESASKEPVESEENETTKRTKPIRRKSIYVERTPLQPDATEDETTKQSKTQLESEDVQVNKPIKAIRRKSMYIERPASLVKETEAIEANKPTKVDDEIKHDVQKPQTGLENSQLTEDSNKHCDKDDLPTKAIQSLKMRRKSMYADSKALNASKPETDNVADKSSHVLNPSKVQDLKKDSKQPNSSSQSLGEHPKDIEATKPAIASFKMRRKSMYLDRNSLKNEEIDKDSQGLKKSEEVKEKNSEETRDNIKKSKEINLEFDNSILTSRKSTNHQTNLARHSLSKQQMDTDSDSLMTQQKPHKMRRKSTNQRNNLDFHNQDKNASEEFNNTDQELEKATENKRLKIDCSHRIGSGSDSPDVLAESIKMRRKSTNQRANLDANSPVPQSKKVLEVAKKSKQDSEEFSRKIATKQVYNAPESIKDRRKSTNQRSNSSSSIQEAVKKDTTELKEAKQEVSKRSEDSKFHISSSQQMDSEVKSKQEKPIKMRRKSTIERVNSEYVEAAETSQSSKSKQVFEERSEDKNSNIESSKEIDTTSSLKMRRKSTNQPQTKENSSKGIESAMTTDVSHHKQEDTEGTPLVLTPPKPNKLRRKSINQRRILDSSSDDNEPLIKKSTVIETELKTPLTTTTAAPKSRTRKKRVVKVLSTSMESSPLTNNTNSSQQSSSSRQPSPLTSPNHPIFDTEVPTQSTEFAASMPMTPNQQDDKKFKEIDSKLHEIFQSPQYTVDYKISAAVDASNLVILPPPSNDSINEISNFNTELNQSSVNMSSSQLNETRNSTLNDTAASQSGSEIKHLSLGTADYRFEKVSDNVINLFISRKRKRKRNN